MLIVTATLMPPFLQQLMGYPVFTTGVVLAPRGAGMMVSMMLVSRLIGRMDARILIGLGFALAALSLYDMTLFNLNVSESRIVWNGILLGFGLGSYSRRSPCSPSRPCRRGCAPRGRR